MEAFLLYGILLAGSPAFGLEVLLLGTGGNLSSISRGKIKLLLASAGLGLIIVSASIGLGRAFSLSPLYLCVLILVLTFITGRSLPLDSGKTLDKIPAGKETAEDEIKSMLKNRGLEKLIKKGDQNDSEE